MRSMNGLTIEAASRPGPVGFEPAARITRESDGETVTVALPIGFYRDEFMALRAAGSAIHEALWICWPVGGAVRVQWGFTALFTALRASATPA